MIFLVYLHLLGLSGGVETFAVQARVFNTSFGTQQMLVYRKSYLVPIDTVGCINCLIPIPR